MNLKNYTSGVSTDITIARIERLLVNAGATGIAKEYAEGETSALMFQLPHGARNITIKLPANIEACLDAFWKDYMTSSVRGRKEREDFREQAARTAWRLQQDWIEVQISLINLNQQDVMQVFLPHIWQKGETYYESLKRNNFRHLALEDKT